MTLSPTQMSCMAYMSAEGDMPIEYINVLTLASLVRRGFVTVFKRNRVVKMTSLGEEEYAWNTNRKYLKWKDEIVKARELKYGKK